MRKALYIGAFVVTLALIPGALLFYVLAKVGFKSGKLPFEPDWKS